MVKGEGWGEAVRGAVAQWTRGELLGAGPSLPGSGPTSTYSIGAR